jgi:small subunit ribosomal protein S6
MNLYEVIFAFKPDLAKETVDEINEKIKSYVTENKGEIDAFDEWGLKKFAYPVEKYFEGNFYLFRFSLDADLIIQIRDMLRLDERLIRYNIMKIDKDFSLRKKKHKKNIKERPVEKVAEKKPEQENK